MEIVSRKDLILEAKKCGFIFPDMEDIKIIRPYHYHEWDHGYDGYYGYLGTRREFYEDLKDMVDFLYAYLKRCNIKEVIVSPLHKYNIFTWRGKIKDDDNCFDIYMEAIEFLKNNGLNRGSHSGIKLEIDGNRRVIEMILEGAYRNVLQLSLFLPDRGVIIEPTHHFDFIFYSKNFNEEKAIIQDLLVTHKNLRYYDEEFLKNKTLYHKKYINHFGREWAHEGCDFCGARISERVEDLHEGYCTEDEEDWICEKCYNELKETFNWNRVEEMN